MFAFRRIPFDTYFSFPSVFLDEEEEDDLFTSPFAIPSSENDNKRLTNYLNDDTCLCRRATKKNSIKRSPFFDALQKLDTNGFGRMTMKENDSGYEMNLDLPGMKKEDLKVSFEGNNLIIEGERKEEKEEKNEKMLMSERHFGSFYRSFSLPENANTESVSASYCDGVLNIVFDKKESDKKYICVN